MRSKLMGTMAALSLAVIVTACGNNGQDAGSSQKEPVQTTESADKTAEQSGDEIADLLGKTLIPDGERDYYQNYFTKKYDKVRRDDISDWKDSDGNWCYPKGYEIQWKPSDDELMASQQFPQELLEDMNTGELYQFIRKAHGFWAQSAFDNYAQMC